jgi:hypothetical protein
MKEKLSNKPEVANGMIPSFSPCCKRLTPVWSFNNFGMMHLVLTCFKGPGYLEALSKHNVDVILKPIECVVPTGIRTSDGHVREVDAIICATGFDTTYKNRFPVYGRNGLKLGDKWREFPDSYLSVTTDGFPNFFMSLGPNSNLGAGNLLMLVEQMARYIGQCMVKLARENIRTMAPKKQVVAAFTKFCDEYFKTTVFSEECSSWYKSGGIDGKVSALWPG